MKKKLTLWQKIDQAARRGTGTHLNAEEVAQINAVAVQGGHMPKKIIIDQLERILHSEEDVPIEILPSGEIVVKGSIEPNKDRKPLTMRENLGGEYRNACSSMSPVPCGGF